MKPGYQNLFNEHLNSLSTGFRLKVERLIENCFSRGAGMYPIESLRNPRIQAKYWRRGRSKKEISEKVTELRRARADFLADCICGADPGSGPCVTNAIPGLSWHQWGEAIDFVWIVNGMPVWDIDIRINQVNGYMIYGREAKRLGLECGLFWETFTDAGHVQLRKAAHPGKIYSLSYINNVMKREFF